MATFSGLIDVMEHDGPDLQVHPGGTHLVHIDDVALRFRTRQQLAAFLDALHDQLHAAGEQTALDVDEYHRRFQALQALRAVK